MQASESTAQSDGTFTDQPGRAKDPKPQSDCVSPFYSALKYVPIFFLLLSSGQIRFHAPPYFARKVRMHEASQPPNITLSFCSHSYCPIWLMWKSRVGNGRNWRSAAGSVNSSAGNATHPVKYPNRSKSIFCFSTRSMVVSVAFAVLLSIEPCGNGRGRNKVTGSSRKTPKDPISAYLSRPILYVPQNKSPLVSEAATTFIIHRS